MKAHYFLIGVGCFVLVMTAKLSAQATHVTARNLGLGGGGTAYVESYHANFINPANLMLGVERYPRFSLGLVGGISTGAGGPLLNVAVYNRYFTRGLTFTGQLSAEALDKWFGTAPANMRHVGLQLDIVPVGVAYRGEAWSAALALRTRMLATVGLSRGMAELGLYGLDRQVFSSPRPLNARMEILSFHELSAGYARRLKVLEKAFGFTHNVRIYGGVAPKLLLGAHTSQMALQSTLVLEGADRGEIEMIRHDFTYSLQTSGELSRQLTRFHRDRLKHGKLPYLRDYIKPRPRDLYMISGLGWGFDMGATMELDLEVPFIGSWFRGNELLRAGVSLTDVGAITFSDKAERFSADHILEWRGFEYDRQRIRNEFDGSREEYVHHVLMDSLAGKVYGSFAPEGHNKIRRTLPARVSAGAQLILQKLSLSIDLSKGFAEHGTGSHRTSISGGLEYRLMGFIPIRMGLRTGRFSHTSYSAGLGVELANFEFSVSASTVRRSLNYGSDIGAAWSGLVFRF